MSSDRFPSIVRSPPVRLGKYTCKQAEGKLVMQLAAAPVFSRRELPR